MCVCFVQGVSVNICCGPLWLLLVSTRLVMVDKSLVMVDKSLVLSILVVVCQCYVLANL